MRHTYAPLFLLSLAAALTGCPENPQTDGGMDAAGARGLVRWGSVACNAPYDAGPQPDGCGRPSQHSSNTGINGVPSEMTMTCNARVESDGRTVVVGFNANETHDPTLWPGALSLRGPASALVVSPTMVGQPVQQCEVRVTEGGRTAVGRCGEQCTVTITGVVTETQTVSGTIRCSFMADDSTPVQYRTLRNSDGVPGMNATFDIAVASCQPAP